MEKSSTFKIILVVVKANHPKATALSKKIAYWLKERGFVVHVHVRENTNDETIYKDIHPDLIIVLGGDGTVLAVARAFVNNPVPLVACNFGRVGFLAEMTPSNWEASISRILAGKYNIVKRTALGFRIWRQGEILHEGHAINDVVVSRGALSRVVSLEVHVDTEYISTLRADGLIFSSPVGSTGYAVSAGGPLVHPANNVLTVTAICPYLCNFPSMILPPTMPIRVTILQCSIETYAFIDGQENFLLETQDTVEVFCVPSAMYFARIKKDRYFTPLRERGFIHGLK